MLTKLPRRIKGRPVRHRSLFDYLQEGRSKGSEKASEGRNVEVGIDKQGVLNHKVSSSISDDALSIENRGVKDKSVGEDILSLLSILDRKSKTGEASRSNAGSPTVLTPNTINSAINASGSELMNIINTGESIADIDLGTLKLPTGRVLDEILEYGLGKDDVICYSNGNCSDNVSVGETYTDKYGFLRQRGFVNTTRVTIYTDWIVEKGVVKKILPKAYGLKTNRGAVALVPEDYLCELEARYGIKLLNYDKCKNYKAIIEWGSKSRSSKRRKRR